MKGKRLVVMLSMLAFIVVLVVVNSTLFTLQKVSINWMTTKNNLQSIRDFEIIKDIEVGQNIFLLKKDNIAEELEKKYEFLRIVGIETKFPNKIVIHAAERESLYAIALTDDGQGLVDKRKYAIVDELGKILDIVDDSYFEGVVGTLGVRPIKLEFMYNHLGLNLSNFTIGEFVEDSFIVQLLKTLSYSLRESRYNPTTSKGVFELITVARRENKIDVTMKTRCGIDLTIWDVENYTTDKLILAFERYNFYHYKGDVDLEIIITWFNGRPVSNC